MTTRLTVNSKTNGTLKQNKNVSKSLMHVAASFFFSLIAFTAMSFTQDDTTKKAEDKTVTQVTNTVADSCCIVNFANGLQHIVFRTKPAFRLELRTNNASLKTWAQTIVFNSDKAADMQFVDLADNNIDNLFTSIELMNHNMAVEYSNKLKTEKFEADEELNEVFTQTVAAPLFRQALTAETTVADGLMDKTMNDDLENRIKAAQFSKTIGFEKQAADNDMDYMVNASGLQNLSPVTGSDADQQIDDLLAKNTFNSVHPMTAFDADRIMDELLKNRN